MNNKTLKGSRELYDLRDEAAAGLTALIDMFIDSKIVFISRVKRKGISQSITSYASAALYGQTMFFYAFQAMKSLANFPPQVTAPHLGWIRAMEHSLSEALEFVMTNTRGSWNESNQFYQAANNVKAMASKDFQDINNTPSIREITTKARVIYNSIATSTCPECDGSGTSQIDIALGMKHGTCLSCMGEGTRTDHDLIYQHNEYKFDYQKVLDKFHGVINA
jgi:hypothetical protein